MGIAERAKLLYFVAGCLAAGALASGINGELASSVWALFVSFDALQAWLEARSTWLLCAPSPAGRCPRNGVPDRPAASPGLTALVRDHVT